MRIVTYECEECGTEVVVTETGGTALMPIYCCGMEVTEVSSVPKTAGKKKSAAAKRGKTPAKSVKKITKKVAAKSTAKKASTAKKKTAVARKKVKK